MMLLRLRERFSCWAVLTRKGIDAMYKAYKKGRRKSGETPVVTKQKLAQTRAGQTRGLGRRSRRHRPPRERWGEARGGRRPQPTMEDPSRDDAGQTTVRRSSRAGRDEGGSRTLRRSAGGCTKRLGAAGTRGTMWKTASASPPSGGRPRLVADHTHKEPCTKIARAGTCSFLPISQ